MKRELPKAVIRRLPIYYRGLNRLRSQGISRVLSSQLSEYLKIESTTIRKDFSYFGELGKQGYGYEIDNLIKVFEEELDTHKEEKAILIGAGNLGQALINYNFIKNHHVSIHKAFDIDENKIGTTIRDVPIYNVNDIEIEADGAKIAILAISGQQAGEIVPRLKEAGIKGVLNFSSRRFGNDEDIIFHNVDLASELQSLVYIVNNTTEK